MRVAPSDVINRRYVLKKSRDTLQAVGDLGADGIEIQPTALLEVGELGDLEPVQHYLPADSPRAEGRSFPVVLFKANVMILQPDAEVGQTAEINVLNVGWRR